MGKQLSGKRVAFMVTDGVEQTELTRPWEAVTEAGAQAELISLSAGEIRGFNHLDKADTFKVDRTFDKADPSDYDALVLPGGVANGDFLRADKQAVVFAAVSLSKASQSADLPRCLDARGGRRGQGPNADLMA
jgi:protease I